MLTDPPSLATSMPARPSKRCAKPSLISFGLPSLNSMTSPNGAKAALVKGSIGSINMSDIRLAAAHEARAAASFLRSSGRRRQPTLRAICGIDLAIEHTMRPLAVDVTFPGGNSDSGDAIADIIAERPRDSDEPIDGKDQDEADGGNRGY